MPAIITDRIKRQFTQQVFDENEGINLGDSDNYFYIGVGHSQIWQPALGTDVTPDPSNTERDRRLFRYNMQSVKAVEAFSFVAVINFFLRIYIAFSCYRILEGSFVKLYSDYIFFFAIFFYLFFLFLLKLRTIIKH